MRMDPGTGQPRTQLAPMAAPVRLEDLLGAVGGGDRAAFEALYVRVAGPVYGLIHRVLRDSAQAQEVAQEVLLAVWCHAGRYVESRGSAMAWVMTIAHRRAVDRVRSEQSRTERRQWLADRGGETCFDCVAEDVQIGLDRAAVRACLGVLSDLQRESVMLAYYAGYTYREVAAVLGVPAGTVKSRIRDGLIRMRGCLGVVT